MAIFLSKKTKTLQGYQKMNDELMRLAHNQEGFLGIESFSDEMGHDVSIVSFKTEDDMLRWKKLPYHVEAQNTGRANWYEHYSVRVCKVEREYEFNKNE